MIPYQKPFLSIPDQVARITARGMAVPDRDKAVHYLSQIGYYRLSGYWYPFRQSELRIGADGKPYTKVLDTFRDGVTFDHVIGLYVFDKRLRLLMMDVLERIEIAFRTDIALQLGQYSPWAYREPQYLDGRFSTVVPPRGRTTRFDQFLTKFDKSVDDSKEDFVKHFRTTYSDPLPIWAAVELWDFGSLSVFISGTKYKDQRDIALKYGIPRPQLFPTWVRTLGFVRNVCAHHSRLWNKPLVAEPMSPAIGEVTALDHLSGDKYAQEHFYSAAAIARFFQKQINPTSGWGLRFREAAASFPQAPGIVLGHAGFPQDWDKLQLWQD